MKFLRSYIDFRITGDNISRLISVIFKQGIECRNLVNKGNELSGSCSSKEWSRLFNECGKLNLECEIHERKSIYFIFRLLKKRKGLITGFVFGLTLITLLSNTFLRLRVKCEDKELKGKIEEYILSKGIDYGSFIPSLDIYSLELNMLQEVEEVSWVGIYLTGGTLNVDLVENVDKPEYNQKRLPSNLIAIRDGEIVSVEIYSGRLAVPIGSGVHSGQVLVSGEVQLSEDMTVFRRSQGKVFAKVVYEEEFFCPFEYEEKEVSSNAMNKNYLSFYSLDIPLDFKNYEGLYETNEKSSKITFLGLDLPIKYKTVNYKKYNYEMVKLTKEEAIEKAYSFADNFKVNFLSESEIIEESEQVITEENGVTLKKKYVVIENIAVEKEFLVK